MRKDNHANSVWGGSLNTLAQTGTEICKETAVMPATIVVGQGSPLGDNKVLKGRAKRKCITQKSVLSLKDIAANRENHDMVKSLWNTYHCQNRLVSHEGMYYGKYCKNRFCTLCCSIRKADIINRYLPVMQGWEKPYFITLTIKACTQASLKKMMYAIVRGFRIILNRCNKRAQRGQGIQLKGIRSLECNFNPAKLTYNPHLHLTVESKEVAETILKEWLQLWTPKFARLPAQYIRPVSNLESDLTETIKYGSKIFTEPDANKKSKTENIRFIYAKAHCNIIEAMKGLRLFDRFGFNTPKIQRDRPGARVVNNFSEWVYVPEFHDWLNTETEQTLSGYSPMPETRYLLENCIDAELE